MQAYSDPKRENMPHALPDVEVFQGSDYPAEPGDEGEALEPDKWYYWACFPGCLPDSDPFGPFNSEAEAIAAAQEDAQDSLYECADCGHGDHPTSECPNV